ncbi:hypothetical protein F385_3651 [Pantoea agglomerans 299R]|nr:hypothetical protein F385_3651 [Pantoea agglomerans 299R]
MLTDKVTALQHKLDVIPDRTADKTLSRVKEVVSEDNQTSAKPGQTP